MNAPLLPLLLLLAACSVSALRNYTIVRYLNVSTTLGPVRGGVIETSGAEDGTVVHIGSFLGINFAKVPTGEFRFAHPVFTQWDFVQDAVTFDQTCFQDPGSSGDYSRMAENCIAANIWTPYNGTTSTPGSYPVLVWIHGGRFESGSINDEATTGRVLTSHESIVTVTLQYRLGVLGFLRLSSTVAPGNMGLKDQALGLEFIHNNIEKFGGNLQTVTLMGIDAGAASVGYHMLNENTRTFFKRAVMLGGSPMVYWSVRKDTASVEALHLDFAIRELGCPAPQQNDYTGTLQCLRGVSPQFLVQKQADFNRLFQGIEFPPVIDGDYIKEDPVEAFRSGRFNAMSLMIGVTNAEAGLYVERSLESQKLTQEQLADKTIYETVLKDQFKYYERQPDELTKTGQTVLIDRLTDFGNPSGAAQFQRWLGGASDRIYVCPANDFADSMFSKAQGTPSDIYYYVFSEQDLFSSNYLGASHGQDAFYFFGNPSDDAPIVKPEQKLLADRMMDYLAKFVANGDPVPSDGDRVWAKYNSSHKYFHNFSSSLNYQYLEPYGFRRDECGFWDKTLGFVDQLVEPLPTTPGTTTATTPTVPTGTSTVPTVPTGTGTVPTVPTGTGTVPTVPTGTGTVPTVPTGTGTVPTVPTGTAPTDSPHSTAPPAETCDFLFNQAAAITLGVLLPTNAVTVGAIVFVYIKYTAARRIMPV